MLMFYLFSYSAARGLIFCVPSCTTGYVLQIFIMKFPFLIQLFRGPSLPGWLCSERSLVPLVIRPQGCIDEAEPWVFRVGSLFAFLLLIHIIPNQLIRYFYHSKLWHWQFRKLVDLSAETKGEWRRYVPGVPERKENGVPN